MGVFDMLILNIFISFWQNIEKKTMFLKNAYFEYFRFFWQNIEKKTMFLKNVYFVFSA